MVTDLRKVNVLCSSVLYTGIFRCPSIILQCYHHRTKPHIDCATRITDLYTLLFDVTMMCTTKGSP